MTKRLILLLSFFVATAAMAQTSGSVSGDVVDESGGAVSGAQVTLRGIDGVPRGRATTGANRNFSLTGLMPTGSTPPRPPTSRTASMR
jgi:hypothetical protein